MTNSVILPWRKEHKREALRRTYEIAARLAGGPPASQERAKNAAFFASGNSRSEKWFRLGLKSWAKLTAARIDQEVARVRRRAEAKP